MRPVLVSCGLDEAIKWGKPCYSRAGRSGAKQAATREARVEKCVQKILDGKGFRDHCPPPNLFHTWFEAQQSYATTKRGGRNATMTLR